MISMMSILMILSTQRMIYSVKRKMRAMVLTILMIQTLKKSVIMILPLKMTMKRSTSRHFRSSTTGYLLWIIMTYSRLYSHC